MIGIIAAIDKSGILGVDGKIPWKSKADMKRFRQITTDTTVIMGRKTWDSIPMRPIPLPNRTIIVVSRQPSLPDLIPGEYPNGRVSLAGNVREAVLLASKLNLGVDVWILGGAEIYKHGFEFADKIDLTTVALNVDVSGAKQIVRFPNIPSCFELESSIINPDDTSLTHTLYIRK